MKSRVKWIGDEWGAGVLISSFVALLALLFGVSQRLGAMMSHHSMSHVSQAVQQLARKNTFFIFLVSSVLPYNGIEYIHNGTSSSSSFDKGRMKKKGGTNEDEVR